MFNLSDATSLSFTGNVYGSILATNADVTANGAVFGQLVAKDVSGNIQVVDTPFAGDISAVPEPETPAMLFAGLALMGFIQDGGNSGSP